MFSRKLIAISLTFWLAMLQVAISIGKLFIFQFKLFYKYFFWFAPFGYLYFSYFSTMNQNWVQESILAWL